MIGIGILIGLLMILVVILSIICLMQKADIEDLKYSNRCLEEMYGKESDKNAELAAKYFMDDIELLNRII